MDSRLQLRVQRYGWDAAAPYYQDGWQNVLRPAQQTLIAMADLSPGQSVLETACGSGLVTAMIADAVTPGGRVLATDLSQKMVDVTAARELPGVETARMGAEVLEVTDHSFDRALCALGLMYSPDPRAAMAEMFRVLAPGGRAVGTVWGERRHCGWADIFPIVDAQVASEVCPLFFATGAPGGLEADFTAAGFANVKEHRQSEILHFTDARHLLDAVIIGGPVALAVTRFSAVQKKRVDEEFLASVGDYQQADGSYAIPGEFVTVTGVKPQE